MSCVLKPTMPISCSSELYVACPTMINVSDWLMKHHTTVTSQECCGKKYDIFASTECAISGSKQEYISANVAIPLGPLVLELATELDVRYGFDLPHSDQVTISVKYPLLPSVKAGTFKGDLRNSCGITMSVGVPEIYGTITVSIKKDPSGSFVSLWVKFDFWVFRTEYKGEFAVLPIPYWFMFSPETLIAAKGAALTKALTASGVGELEASSISVHNETNNVTNIVAPAAVAVAAVTPTA